MSDCPKFEPIRDYTHLERVENEISRLRTTRPDDISEEESQLLHAYMQALESYMPYCPRRSLKPSPWCLLRYQLTHVRKLQTDEAAREIGMPTQDLHDLVSGSRLPTIAEGNLLAGYFQTVPDAFLTVPEDDDD
jgi:hypothetical protein